MKIKYLENQSISIKKIQLLFLFFLCFNIVKSQEVKIDKGDFIEYEQGYYENSILRGISEYKEAKCEKKVYRRFKMIVDSANLPNNIDLYTKFWHNAPLSQGNASTCWSYAGTSFFESEIKRINNLEVKLSELYTAYWEYVEKTMQFIKLRGNSYFDEGSEANAVTRIMKKYGAVPENVYSGLVDGQKVHNHIEMVKEMTTYLNSVKQNSAWNEEIIISTIKSILNKYIGTPPNEFVVNGKKYTPKSYFEQVLKLNLDDYYEIMSLKEINYWQKGEYKALDNWWHCSDYYNVPLDDFMAILKKAIEKGYGVGVGGDITEPGMDSKTQTGQIPSFDIPSKFINEDARQFRFNNKSTTDDHGLHIVGYYTKDGQTWYLLKDSGAGSRNGFLDKKNFGYYFYHEDFIKLKMMNITVHKDIIIDILKNFK